MKRTLPSTLFSLLLITVTTMGYAQVAKDSKLYRELKTMDSLMFERSFNGCDLTYLESIVSESLEFIHDLGGIQNKQSFLEAMSKNICGNLEKKPIRKLVEGSLEVYPLYENGKLYGGIQHGEHMFYIREKEKPDEATGIAKFTSVWFLEEGHWKYARGLSYDHQPIKK